jgi:hypothetical protein
LSIIGEGIEEFGISIFQHDVSDIVGEHIYYWDNMQSILMRMHFIDITYESQSEESDKEESIGSNEEYDQ